MSQSRPVLDVVPNEGWDPRRSRLPLEARIATPGFPTRAMPRDQHCEAQPGVVVASLDDRAGAAKFANELVPLASSTRLPFTRMVSSTVGAGRSPLLPNRPAGGASEASEAHRGAASPRVRCSSGAGVPGESG